jgi:D-amino peptidase
MKPVKRVYIMTDLEGVAGIDAWDPRLDAHSDSARGVAERSEMQRLLTGEVNAAAQGLFDAGVEEVLVNDAHGAGRTILVEELISGVRIVRGVKRPAWLPGIDPRFDALVQVAMHSMSNTPHGNLAHTMSTTVDCYRINGRNVGEMEIAAYLVGQLGIPWIFTSGDVHACRESEEWVPGIVTAPVKEGLAELCAIHLAPVDARRLIRARVAEAVSRAGEIKPLQAGTPATYDMRGREPGPLDVGPGGERLDAFTVRYHGETIWQAFHLAHYGADAPLPA